MENSEIRLLLLDFDGTLADTRRANTLSYVAALGEAGYTLTEEEYAARYFGMRCNEFLTRFGIADPAERERLRLRKIALYPTFFDTVRLNEPLWTFCRQFRAGSGRVWVVSTGSRANIDNVMRHLGIGGPTAEGGVSETGFHSGVTDPAAPLGRVDGILSGADVERPKPAPDCFLEAMRREGAMLGGEQSGHLIFRGYSTTGDGLLAALQILRIMREKEKPLSELAGLLTPFPQKLVNVRVEKRLPFEERPGIGEAVARVEKELAGRGRVLLRYSGTEALCRIMVEGEDEDKVKVYAADLAEVVARELR